MRMGSRDSVISMLDTARFKKKVLGMERRFLFFYIAKHQRIAADSEHEEEDRYGDFYSDLSVLSVGN